MLPFEVVLRIRLDVDLTRPEEETPRPLAAVVLRPAVDRMRRAVVPAFPAEAPLSAAMPRTLRLPESALRPCRARLVIVVRP